MSRAQAYERFLYPMIERLHLDPELAHQSVLHVLKYLQVLPLGLPLLKWMTGAGTSWVSDNVEVGGLHFENPLVLAEGFDKDGVAVRALMALGFGSVIVGSVTKKPQTGNAKPRIFRGDNSLLNHMGFPSLGADRVARNLERQRRYIDAPLGISLGLNKDTPHDEAAAEYAGVLSRLYDLGDYFALNAASPNTSDLRNLLRIPYLSRILETTQNILLKRGFKPLFVKLSPDSTLEEIDAIAALCSRMEVTGVIATNTSSDPSRKHLMGNYGELPGGVSGRPLRQRATEIIAYLHSAFPSLKIIGMGGIDSKATALEKLDAGADLIGIYTSLVFHGPSFPSILIKELIDHEKIQSKKI